MYNKNSSDPINDPVEYYNFNDKLKLWNLISAKQKQRLLDIATSSYAGEKTIELLNAGVLSTDAAYSLVRNYMAAAHYSSNFLEIVNKVSSFGTKYEEQFRKFLTSLGPQKGFAARALFCYKDLTIEEEVAGLRSCTAGASYELSSFISELKYQPRAEALKEMPTVMRLACLERLTNDIFASYNIFGKITDDEEFKSLLFGPVLRHQERAEAIWERYCELKLSGTPGKITITYDCSKCGEIKITFESNVVRTKGRIRSTRFGENLLTPYCPVCRTKSSPPTVHGTEEFFNEERNS